MLWRELNAGPTIVDWIYLVRLIGSEKLKWESKAESKMAICSKPARQQRNYTQHSVDIL